MACSDQEAGAAIICVYLERVRHATANVLIPNAGL